MEREDLEKKYQELKKELRDGSKKKADFDLVIKELESIRNQIDITPMHFFVNESDIEDSYEGDSFAIYKTNRYIHFKTRGGYNLFVEPKNTSLYSTIEEYMKNLKRIEDMSIEELDTFETYSSIITYILECPLFAFGNYETAISIATKIIEELSKRLKESEEADLQKEEIEKNEVFEEISKGLDFISNNSDEISKNIEDASDIIKDKIK